MRVRSKPVEFEALGLGPATTADRLVVFAGCDFEDATGILKEARGQRLWVLKNTVTGEMGLVRDDDFKLGFEVVEGI